MLGPRFTPATQATSSRAAGSASTARAKVMPSANHDPGFGLVSSGLPRFT